MVNDTTELLTIHHKMNRLEIANRFVEVNTDALAKGLCEMHEMDDDKKAVLAFGMLDHGLCELMRKQLATHVRAQYSTEANELFSARISDFITQCTNDIEKGVYKYAKMVV